jgi:hypothetical protein
VKSGPRGSAGAHLSREARSGAEEHVAAPELSSQGGRARSHGTRGSTGAHLNRDARSRAEEHIAAPELNLVRRRDPGPYDSTGAHLSKEVRPGAAGHVAAPVPTFAGRCGPKIQLMWQRVDVHSILVLTYRLYTGVSGLQGFDRGLQAHLGRGCEPVGGANFLTPRSVILSFYSAVDDGPRELPSWKCRTCTYSNMQQQSGMLIEASLIHCENCEYSLLMFRMYSSLHLG